MQRPSPSLEQVIKSLIAEVLKGRAALEIAVGLSKADPVVLSAAPVFFGMAYDGNLELAQLYAARLYDHNAEAIDVEVLLDLAERTAGLARRGKPSEVRAMIATCRAKVQSLKVPLASIKKRRDEALAHLALESVLNPGSLKQTAPLTLAEIQQVFDETEKILQQVDSFFRAISGQLRYLGHDDYTMVLDLMSDAKCAQADNYEKAFGEPPNWPLPAKCAKRK
jgi:hypothetical protein